VKKLNVSKNYLFLKFLTKTTDRSIKENPRVITRGMRSEVTEWWKGLGEDLEDDIEMIDEQDS